MTVQFVFQEITSKTMKEEKKQSPIISLLLLAAIVLVGLLWLKPNMDQVSALRLVEREREQTSSQLQSELSSLQSARATLSGASEIDQVTVLAAIPENFEQDNLINQISEIARKYDVNIGSISFSIPFSSSEEVKRGGVSISMTGTESDLLRLLSGIENNARKLVVRSITVQLGQTGGYDRANFSIAIDTFFQKGI